MWYYRVAEEADFEMHPDMREEHVAQERARRAWDAVVEEQVSMMSSHDVDDLLELAPDSSKRILAYVPQDPEFLEVYKRSILPFIIAADGEGDLAQHFSETQGVQDAYNLFIEVYLRPQERARKIWHDHAQDFSRIYEGVIPEQELATLREQYLNIGYRVRYVSYEELSHEPPCAGVDHQPE
ncbi:hypothetical protein GVX82_03505 [Patescibacteria group bacterium]|nr:hypothetical protein [Patescibacteria group bacterium]